MYSLLVSTINLLADAEEAAPEKSWFQTYGIWIVLGVVAVALFGWFFFSGKKNKQRQKEYVEQLDAIAPGNKVKTAGGICGIVTEVCDDNTVIIKTGSEDSGYSFIKMEKELIAQTDAKGPTQIAREEADERRRAEKEEKERGTTFGDAPAKEEAKEEPAKTEEPAAEKADEEDVKKDGE